MAAHQNVCCLAVEFDKNKTEAGKYMLLLCDTGGTIVGEKYLEIRPAYITMNSSYVIVTTNVQFILWNYKNLSSNQSKFCNE